MFVIFPNDTEIPLSNGTVLLAKADVPLEVKEMQETADAPGFYDFYLGDLVAAYGVPAIFSFESNRHE